MKIDLTARYATTDVKTIDALLKTHLPSEATVAWRQDCAAPTDQQWRVESVRWGRWESNHNRWVKISTAGMAWVGAAALEADPTMPGQPIDAIPRTEVTTADLSAAEQFYDLQPR